MKRIIILLSVLLLLPAWSQAEIKQPGDTTLSKGLTPYVPEISTDHAPKVRKLAKQLLALIDSMHTEEDFTTQHIKNTIGISLDSHINYLSYYYSFKIFYPWWFGIDLQLSEINHPIIAIRIGTNEMKNLDRTAVCLDLGRFHQALQEMGYQHTGNFRGSLPGIQYRRGQINLDFTYVGENDERFNHDCIISFSIYINKPEQLR